MNIAEGARVGAIFDAKDKTVRFIGWGVFDGDHPAPDDSFMRGIPNPRLTLDNGKVVWGFECWWGTEEKIKTILARYENIEEVDIEELRKLAHIGPDPEPAK